MQLLENLCRNIDGFLTFVTGFVLQVIHFSLVSDQVNDIPEKFPRLKQYKDTVFFVKTNAQIRVDTCILVLADIANQTQEREDLM